MKKIFQAVFILCNISLCSDRAFAQSITFQKSIGRSLEDYANSVQQTKKLTLIFLMILFSFSSYCFAQCTKLYDFYSPNGSYPYGSLIYDGNSLLGMTESGGNNSGGVIFKIKTNGTGYSNLYHFADTNGYSPFGSLISDGTFLYGMTTWGGINGFGTIFRIKPDGTEYLKLFDFEDGLNGYLPQGSLVSDGIFLYGTTTWGGIYDNGVIFRIKPDGTGFSKLWDFDGINGTGGEGSLVYDNLFLYGITVLGGAKGYGTIFKIKPDGTDYSKLFDFDSLNGRLPYGSLLLDGLFLYGMTSQGGDYNRGIVFKIKPDGTDYTKLLDFNGINGGNPRGSLISDGIFLYGMTSLGGINDQGVLFKIKPDGTEYYKYLDFPGIANGELPYGSLVSDGLFLYGMTRSGGISNSGIIFKCDIINNVFNEIIKSDYSIYPNPSSSKISFDQNFPHASIRIFNILGENIYSGKFEKELDVSFLTEGIYIIEITSPQNTYRAKFVKE